MNFTASAALCRERVSTSWISKTRARAHRRPHARPTRPEPMMFRVFKGYISPPRRQDRQECIVRTLEQMRLVSRITPFEEPAHQRFPFLLESPFRPLGPGAGVPVVGVREITFLAVEIGVHALGGPAALRLHDLVRALPVAPCVVPQG